MRVIAFVVALGLASAQVPRVFPAVKLAGSGTFGQGPQNFAELQQEVESSFRGAVDVGVSQQEEANNQPQADPVAFLPNGVFEPLNLPAGASLLLGDIDTSFECADSPYGYYSDERNACRLFHVCLPYLFSDGRVETNQYSFMCGENTIFDQEKFACVEQSAAIACEDTSFFFARNEEFGLPEEKL